jgi:hypothetical protein
MLTGLGKKNWKGGFRPPAPKEGWVRYLKLNLQIFTTSIYGRVGDSLLNDGSRTPKVQGGVNGYLSVM